MISSSSFIVEVFRGSFNMLARYFAVILTASALIGLVYSNNTEETVAAVRRCQSRMQFNLYTRIHPERYWFDLLNIEESVKHSTMDFKKQTKFLSFPQALQRNDINFTQIVEKILNKMDVNVIVVEWPLVSKREVSPKEVLNSAAFFEGACLGRLLRHLSDKMQAESDRFHLIAYGEKVPVFVVAAKFTYPFEVGRLTGLDPVADEISSTFYESKTTRERGMIFVDMIYTSLSQNDNVTDFGHVSFFPNGGLHPQPGVEENSRDVSSVRSLLYFVESIERPNAFVAKKCDNWTKYVARACSTSETNKMGEYTSTEKKGHYYLVTNDRPLFGLD